MQNLLWCKILSGPKVYLAHQRSMVVSSAEDGRQQLFAGHASTSHHRAQALYLLRQPSRVCHSLSHLAPPRRMHISRPTRWAKPGHHGWAKVKSFCELARNRGYDYAWIDTCNIDKISSAELQEAINSMYRYYKESKLCIVYLADVMDRNRYRVGQFDVAFRSSRWFQIGWTLQELLAPNVVEFWSSSWNDLIGTKLTLRPVICSITGMHERALLDFNPKTRYAVDILHWASHRQCTRAEDEAYSLL